MAPAATLIQLHSCIGHLDAWLRRLHWYWWLRSLSWNCGLRSLSLCCIDILHILIV